MEGNETHPPELKGFHKKNFLHVSYVALFTFFVGGLGFYRQEKYAANDDIQTALIVLFFVGLLSFMGTVVYKSLVSVPACPQCKCKMKETKTVTIVGEPVFGVKSRSEWRIVECRDCEEKCRIPGLSHGS